MTKRKVIGLFVLFVLLASTIFFTIEKYYARKKAKMRLQLFDQLPLVGLDSTAFDYSLFSKDDISIIVYINTDCQPCRDQAIELKNGVNELVNSSILFISSESICKIERFSNELNLRSVDNMFFSKMNESDVFTVFGSVGTPQVFLYNNEGKLLKEFRGSVNIETITKYIK